MIDSTIQTRLHTARDQHHPPTAHHAPAHPAAAISKTARNNNRQFFGCQRGGGSLELKKLDPPTLRPPTTPNMHSNARRCTYRHDQHTHTRQRHTHVLVCSASTRRTRRRARAMPRSSETTPQLPQNHHHTHQKKPSPNRHMRKSRPPSRRARVAYSKSAHPCAPSGVDRTRGRAVFVERRRNTERANREFRQLARPARSVSSGSHCMYEIAISHKIEYFFPRHRSAARLVVWLIFTIGRRGPPTAGYSHRFFLRRSR